MTTTHDPMADRIEAGDFDKDTSPKHDTKGRRIVITSADTIQVKPVRWLWQDRIARGELSLVAGREGLGKSTLTFQMAAWLTTGTMKGCFFGTPKSVLIAASEDSWEHTIVPRLIGAGADLSRVLRCEVMTKGDLYGTLTFPSDIDALEDVIEDNDVAMMILDPLMSRLSTSIDSHRDAEVRTALEPMKALASKMGIAIVGLIHVNKGAGTDALNLVMGSKAFTAVPRSILMAMKDPAIPGQFLFGLVKNNLGPVEGITTHSYTIETKVVTQTEDGEDVATGVVKWLGKGAESVSQAIVTTAINSHGGEGTLVQETAEWLLDYLEHFKGSADSSKVKKAAHAAGYTDSTLVRARQLLKVETRNVPGVFPRQTMWELPEGVEKPF